MRGRVVALVACVLVATGCYKTYGTRGVENHLDQAVRMTYTIDGRSGFLRPGERTSSDALSDGCVIKSYRFTLRDGTLVGEDDYRVCPDQTLHIYGVGDVRVEDDPPED